MTYPAPDGTIIESSPNHPVIYKCGSHGIKDGVYESFEMTSNYYGLCQIRIVREVINGVMTITITERTKEEIEEYIKSLE
jgi:hypothetical protein